MKLHELREARANKVAEMRGLVDTAEREKRDLAGNETTRFEALKGEVAGLDVRIAQAETLAEFERRAEGEPVTRHGSAIELESRYSIGRALADLLQGGRLTGAEKEWADEHRSRNRAGAGMSFSAPVSAFLGGEQRAVLTTAPSGGPGGNLVATSLGPLTDRPRPQLVTESMGATVLRGLTDNLELPRLASSGSVGWVGEHQNGSKSDPSFAKMSMSPRTCTGTYEVSRKMLLQAPQVDQILRYDLGSIIAQQIDLVATMGTGTGNAPKGIKSTTGVRKVQSGPFADGQNPTVFELDRVLGLMQGLVENSDVRGREGWLTNPRVKSYYGRYRDGNGNVIDQLWGGLPVQTSSQIPANGGTGTNLAHVFYSGNWADLLIGYWSQLDLLFNPYHPDVAMNGGALLHAFLDCDVAVRQPLSFTYTDALPVGGGTTGPTVTTNP